MGKYNDCYNELDYKLAEWKLSSDYVIVVPDSDKKVLNKIFACISIATFDMYLVSRTVQYCIYPYFLDMNYLWNYNHCTDRL